MSKNKNLAILNENIDKLILAGDVKSAEYKRLIDLHFKIVCSK